MVAFVACDEGDDKLSDGTVGGSVTEGGSGDDESDEGGIGVPTTSLIGRWECYRVEWRFDDGILHTEDSPFAIWGSPRVEGSASDNNTDKGNEGGDFQPGGSGTRSSYDENSDDEDDMVIVGYNTRIYEFRADGICHFEGFTPTCPTTRKMSCLPKMYAINLKAKRLCLPTEPLPKSIPWSCRKIGWC